MAQVRKRHADVELACTVIARTRRVIKRGT